MTTSQATPNTGSNLAFRIKADIEEDVEGELEDFVRLSHTCQFASAQELFDECFSEHVTWFPAAAEYVDFLISSYQYDHISPFCRRACSGATGWGSNGSMGAKREATFFELAELTAQCLLRTIPPEEAVPKALGIWPGFRWEIWGEESWIHFDIGVVCNLSIV